MRGRGRRGLESIESSAEEEEIEDQDQEEEKEEVEVTESASPAYAPPNSVRKVFIAHKSKGLDLGPWGIRKYST